jgi:hypothetical protein
MIRYEVESSNIVAVSYSEEQQLMRVEFKNESIYDYYNIPIDYVEALLNANSKGSFLSKIIKPKFASIKIYPVD